MKFVTIPSPSTWSPLAAFDSEMDRFFDEFWRTPREENTEWRPACNAEEKEEHYLVTFEIPGVPKEQLKIEVLENQLVVSGERKDERQHRKFQRGFTLPAGANVDKIDANYQDGVLQLYIPKAERPKPREIKITSGAATGGFFGRLLGQNSQNSTESDPGKSH